MCPLRNEKQAVRVQEESGLSAWELFFLPVTEGVAFRRFCFEARVLCFRGGTLSLDYYWSGEAFEAANVCCLLFNYMLSMDYEKLYRNLQEPLIGVEVELL